MKSERFLFCVFAVAISGCTAINESSKHRMESGVYTIKNDGKKHYYVLAEENSIVIYPVKRVESEWKADSSVKSVIRTDSNTATARPISFISHEISFDILSIVLKYRPPISDFPNQLTTNFNAAGYTGYKTDRYILSFKKNPLGNYDPVMQHFAYSYGAFVGLGAPEITPSVTQNNIDAEYYGTVLTAGIGGMVSLGSLTFGLGIGFDHLLDKNRKLWIYHRKPWLGFTVGLNLD